MNLDYLTTAEAIGLGIVAVIDAATFILVLLARLWPEGEL